MAPQKRQLVVIGGWLGCQRKFLRRYEELYNSLGFETLSLVASPRSTVESTLQLYRGRAPLPPPGWPCSTSSCLGRDYGTTDELAWDVLSKVDELDPNIVLYHSFSNGGCFLWESICRVLEFHRDEACDSEMSRHLQSLSSKFNGVVFDSCPAYFGDPPSKLWHALRHCSDSERQDVLAHYGAEVFTFSKRNKDRSEEYFQRLTQSSFDIPQLYLFSKNDDLSDYHYIETLIRNRRSIQQSPVVTQCWDISKHCSHLREHPEDYKLAIEDFLRVATLRSKL
jgi:hypothetical protein